MRIVLIGQAAFGARVLQALLDQGEAVVGVFAPPAATGTPNPLAELAESRSLPVYRPDRLRGPDAGAALAALRPDLNVMAFVTEIVPQRLLAMPRLGSIQYHPSLLPRHRGGSAIHWAIIGGETKTGLTIFWPDAGIDTGPVLLQREVEIGPDDTTGSLYFGKLLPLGVEAMAEAVGMVRRGEAPRIPQDETKATCEPLCTDERTVIDWFKPVGEVYNLIRGASPSPGAGTLFRGGRLKILEAAPLPDQPRTDPGQVAAVDASGFVVGVQGGAILVRRVLPAGGAKTPAGEFAAVYGLRTGERLG